jgi:hypothetical protein
MPFLDRNTRESLEPDRVQSHIWPVHCQFGDEAISTSAIATGKIDQQWFGLHCLGQFGVFGPGLHENRDIRIGIFPEGEKVLVSAFGLDRISRQSEGPA